MKTHSYLIRKLLDLREVFFKIDLTLKEIGKMIILTEFVIFA